MSSSYLHGVETVPITTGSVPIQIVKTAVTGLVCIAPTGPVNTLTIVASDTDAAQFGPDLFDAGFTARCATNANFSQGLPTAGILLVVNVADPAVHKTAVASETITFSATGTAKTAFPAVIDDGVNAAQFVLKNTSGSVTYVRGTDYTLSPVTGALTLVTGRAIANGASTQGTYSYIDPTLVTSSDIIGTVNGSGNRTGMQTFLNAFQSFGYSPKRLIAPVYSSLNAVAVAMISMANRIRARAYIDAPIGITPSAAIAGRGPSGSINFNTSDPRARLFYPHVQAYDSAGGNRIEPLSQYAAGLGNAVDIAYGYWFSMSNYDIQSIVGIERSISAMINDPNCDANLLNAAGITTIFNSFGTGLRLWGNRTAAWPSNTSPYNFENMQAVADIIAESIEYASLQFLDKPIDNPWIDSVKGSVNGLMRALIGRGAILDGSCWYDPADNPNTQLVNGQAVFRYDFLPPFPAERMTFLTTINTNYLSELGTTTAGA